MIEIKKIDDKLHINIEGDKLLLGKLFMVLIDNLKGYFSKKELIDSIEFVYMSQEEKISELIKLLKGDK